MPNRMYPPMAAVSAQPHHLVSRSPSVCPTNIFGVLDRWRCYSRAGGRARCRCASGRCCPGANWSVATFFITATLHVCSPPAPFLSCYCTNAGRFCSHIRRMCRSFVCAVHNRPMLSPITLFQDHRRSALPTFMMFWTGGGDDPELAAEPVVDAQVADVVPAPIGR